MVKQLPSTDYCGTEQQLPVIGIGSSIYKMWGPTQVEPRRRRRIDRNAKGVEGRSWELSVCPPTAENGFWCISSLKGPKHDDKDDKMTKISIFVIYEIVFHQ